MKEVKFIVIPLLCVIISQILKFIIESIINQKINFGRLFDGAGGMPSSHSALVSSLTTLVGIKLGVGDPMFAVCLCFSCVVTYDAMGVRYETGRQAEIINQLTSSIKLKEQTEKLKEKVGHKPIEVLGGLILGISLTFLLNSII